MDSEVLSYGVTAFVTLFSIVDPFAAAPIFIAMTPSETEKERRSISRQASIVSGAVLLVFAFAGNLIFAFFGISQPAFQFAGGILLLVIALDMLRGGEGPTRQSPEEQEEGIRKSDVSITPLAIPLLAGPGSLSTVALLASRAQAWTQYVALTLAVVITSLLTWMILAHSLRLVRLVGQIGMKIITRIMGLLLAGVGAQFILDGAKQFWR